MKEEKKYKATIGFLTSRATGKALSKKLSEHGKVMTAKVALSGCGINTFVSECDEEGKKIVEKYFKDWIPKGINWEDET